MNVHTSNLLPFPATPVDSSAVFGTQTPDLKAADIQSAELQSPIPDTPALPDQLAEARAALHAGTMSALEIDIMATIWNYHPRPLRLSEIYLEACSSHEDSLELCGSAINHLAARGLVSASGAPSFLYQLSRDGIFAALYLAISGISDKFNVARVEGKTANADAELFTRARPAMQVHPTPELMLQI